MPKCCVLGENCTLAPYCSNACHGVLLFFCFDVWKICVWRVEEQTEIGVWLTWLEKPTVNVLLWKFDNAQDSGGLKSIKTPQKNMMASIIWWLPTNAHVTFKMPYCIPSSMSPMEHAYQTFWTHAEYLLEGVTSNRQVEAATLTNTNGDFKLEIPPGLYTVVETAKQPIVSWCFQHTRQRPQCDHCGC